MPKPTTSDEARIAIALCALKYKPREQSFTSYVLDLRAKFPPTSKTPPSVNLWRERVLGLEQDVAYLKHKYYHERIKTLSLQAPAPPVASTSTALHAPSAKKNTKRKSYPNAVLRTNLQAVLDGFNHDAIPAISMPQSVFSSFDALKILTEFADDETALPTTLLAATTSRAMEGLGGLLRTIISQESCSSESTSVEMLRALATLLSYVITEVLPLFISRLKGKPKGTTQDSPIIFALDEILGRITTLIFIPLARSLGPLSLAYTTNVISSNYAVDGGRAGRIDIRSDLCCLVRQAMSALDHLGALAAATLAHSLCGVRECLALEAVREMERNLLQTTEDDDPCTTTPDPTITDTPKTRTARIHNLARKDTLWYLSSILCILFTPSSATSAARLTSQTPPGRHECVSAAKSQNKLLEDVILTGLSNIIGRSHLCRCFASPSHNEVAEMNERCTDTGISTSSFGDTENGMLSGKCQCRTAAVDEVGHGMILAVIERAWLYWFGLRTDANQFIQP